MIKKYILKIIKEVFGLPLYWLTALIPKKNDIWVFGEWHGLRYADNPRFFYDYLNNKNDKMVRPIWLTKSDSIYNEIKRSGAEVYKTNSLKGMYYSAISQYHFVTHSSGDTNPYFRGRFLVNLTHGTPLKRIGMDARFDRLGPFTKVFDEFVAQILPIKRTADYIICADDMAAERFKSAFPKVQNVIPLGYPRWEAFNVKAIAPELKKLASGFSAVISYMPTLRFNNQKQFDPFAIKGFSSFVDALEKYNILMLVRPHPSMVFSNESINSRHVQFVRSSFIPDVSEVFKVTDLLITDYSSVMFDFKKIEKPIALLVPDLNRYVNDDVGIYGDYIADALGDVVFDWDELIPIISQFVKNKDGQHLPSTHFDVSAHLYELFSNLDH